MSVLFLHKKRTFCTIWQCTVIFRNSAEFCAKSTECKLLIASVLECVESSCALLHRKKAMFHTGGGRKVVYLCTTNEAANYLICAMNRYQLNVKVGESIRNFIISTNGSDIITPERHSILWCLVKQHLVLSSSQQQLNTDIQDKSIKILMLENQSMKTYSVDVGRELSVNTLFRTYISNQGQEAIRDFFDKQINHLFFVFMEGYDITSKPKYVFAIKEFCTRYSLNYDEKIYSKLRKAWYRHRKKIESTDHCPIIF